MHFKIALDKDWRGPVVVMASLGSNAIVKIGRHTYSCRHADMILALDDEVKNLRLEEDEEKNYDNNIIGSEEEENASERIVETLSSLNIGRGYTRTEAPEIRATSVSILEGDYSASVSWSEPFCIHCS